MMVSFKLKGYMDNTWSHQKLKEEIYIQVNYFFSTQFIK